MSYYQDVKQFHIRFWPEHVREYPGWPDPEALSASVLHIREECAELLDAVESASLPDVLDSAIDLVYVVLGLLVRCGLDADEAWRRVHAANMLKVAGPGKRGSVDVIKPAGWQPPNLTDLVDERRNFKPVL